MPVDNTTAPFAFWSLITEIIFEHNHYFKNNWNIEMLYKTLQLRLRSTLAFSAFIPLAERNVVDATLPPLSWSRKSWHSNLKLKFEREREDCGISAFYLYGHPKPFFKAESMMTDSFIHNFYSN
jgi:hypothetical protein